MNTKLRKRDQMGQTVDAKGESKKKKSPRRKHLKRWPHWVPGLEDELFKGETCTCEEKNKSGRTTKREDYFGKKGVGRGGQLEKILGPK